MRPHVQRDGGDLHDRPPGAGVDHPAQQLVQLGRFRRGQRRAARPAADLGPERADDAGAVPARVEHAAHERAGGCLAVAAGHPDQPQRPRRVAGQERAERAELRTHRRHAQLGQVGVDRPVDQQGGGTAGRGGRGVPVAVTRGAADAGEQRTGGDEPGVGHQAAHGEVVGAHRPA
jgi:hypothetical protein